METIARGVAAAHRQAVVHRDLKPANILLANDGQPKITDFGLAKRTDAATATATGAGMGTPTYMAPEQADGAKGVGPAADVYALGVILYEMITGRPPFLGESEIHIIYQLVTQDPVPPRQLVPRTPADLETICLKCLSKDPARRYPTAAEFADDLRRFIDRRPIEARPVGAVERLMKWAARRPAVAALSALSAVAVTVALVGGSILTARLSGALSELQVTNAEIVKEKAAAERGREEAETARKEADRLRGESEDAKERAVTAAEEARTQKARAEGALKSALRARYIADARLAEQARDEGRMQVVEDLLGRMRPRPGDSDDPRGFEWFHLWGRLIRPRLVADAQKGHIYCLGWSPDGRMIAAGGDDGTVALIDPADGRRRATLKGYPRHVFALAFSPDSRRLATGANRCIRPLVWDVSVDPPLELSAALHDKPEWTSAVAYSDDGATLASCGSGGVIRLWDPAGRTPAAELPGHTTMGMGAAFSGDGKTLATVGLDAPDLNGNLRVFDTASRKERFRVGAHQLGARALAVSRDGSLIATGGPDGLVKLWDGTGKSAKPRSVLRGHYGVVMAVAFAPGEKTLASAGLDGTVRLWDVASGEEVGVAGSVDSEVFALCFSPDGRSVAAGCADGKVRVWEARPPPPPYTTLPTGMVVVRIAVSPDGRLAALAGMTPGPLGVPIPGFNTTVEVWDLAAGKRVRALSADTLLTGGVAFSPDGKTLATAGYSGGLSTDKADLKLWDVATGTRTGRGVIMRNGAAAVAFSPDGRLLAVGGVNGEATLVDVASGEVISTAWVDGLLTLAQTFSPDGRRLIAGAGTSGAMLDIDTRTGKVTDGIPGDGIIPVMAMAFSPDGRTLAAAGADGLLHFRRADALRERRIHRTGKIIAAVAYSPDGRVLACGCIDGAVLLIDPETGELRATLKGHSNLAAAVAFTPDGRTLLTTGLDRTLRVWRSADPGEVRRVSAEAAAARPDDPRAAEDLILACWADHLFRVRSGDRPGSRAALEAGREALVNEIKRGRLVAVRDDWMEAFRRAQQE
jgi:WD40 repeat protein